MELARRRDAAGRGPGSRAAAWARANLFSSPAASAASLIALALGTWIAAQSLQWLVWEAYWSGSEPQNCPDKSAACWPFVRARIAEFFYGFYPIEQRWRIDTGLAAGVVLAVVGKLLPRRRRLPVLAPAAPLCLLLALALFHGGWGGLERVPTALWGGAFLTVVCVATVFALALPCGVLLALGRTSRLPAVRALCALWIEFWRAVPALVVLFIATIMFPLFMPANVDVDKLVRALAAMAILMSCYLAEALRGGLYSVPNGQVEAAQALGFGYWQRTWLIVLPQAFTAALPQIASNLIGLLKETTVLLVIGIPDLLGMINAAASDPAWLGEGVIITGYIFAAAVFWVSCFGLSLYARSLERRLSAGGRQARL